MGQFHVLRVGHRPERDKRITTHVALTARAFGASKIYISRPDRRIVKTVNEVVRKFGGNFTVETVSNPKKIANCPLKLPILWHFWVLNLKKWSKFR